MFYYTLIHLRLSHFLIHTYRRNTEEVMLVVATTNFLQLSINGCQCRQLEQTYKFLVVVIENLFDHRFCPSKTEDGYRNSQLK